MAEVRSSMTGTVFTIEVEVGQEVKKGDVVVILESMKMEIPVEAEMDGKVASIAVKEEDFVDEGDVILTFEG
ncbi:acetyl-CoA carboxylase biotin carboxyl carrier protein subunit [Sporosarcina sp. NCCP-2716]|uniref:biotin/lipoyl-binding carrier protein n=1 Tax=Sporosarcina sp. NCCP-2716 TaxID=2943679 RepID=UPI00203EC4A7|nr:biotin/lipoyl-binding carrier protein [Sporosarcina sp. NCCP-2716]GKV67704.1 acetyl-CoA carboxylase biotin carboxyl carrier protein subunit [Sporosarcina sp. NCCP-2716]